MVHVIPESGIARAYLIEEKEGFMAVDVGSIGSARDVEAYCTGILKRPLWDVRFILATHFHIDHIGGIGTLLRRCPPETKVLFHSFVKGYLDGSRRPPPIRNWVSGLLPTAFTSLGHLKKPSHLMFESLSGIPLIGLRNITTLPFGENRIRYLDFGKTELRAPEGEVGAREVARIPLGLGDWEAIETPGHTEDSVSLYSPTSRELICGDLIVNIKKDGSGMLNRFHWDRNALVKTYETLLAAIRPVVIYPGHGAIIRDDENALLKVGLP